MTFAITSLLWGLAVATGICAVEKGIQDADNGIMSVWSVFLIRDDYAVEAEWRTIRRLYS